MERERQTIEATDVGNLEDVLGIGPAHADNMFQMSSSSKEIARITPDGKVIISATEEELEAAAIDELMRPYAILLREILRLRKKVT